MTVSNLLSEERPGFNMSKRRRVLDGCLPSFCLEQEKNLEGSQETSILSTTNFFHSSVEASEVSEAKEGDKEIFWQTLASDMNKLSIDERERVYDDVHGTSEVIQETKELVSSKLLELQMELDNIRDKEAYNLAFSQDPSYVQDAQFRLRFLRCKEFDAAEAAKQIVAHFEVKRSYFDDETLGRTLRMSDLDEGSLHCLQLGGCQILPDKDKSGRTILMCVHRNLEPVSAIDLARSYFYQGMVLLDDEDVQKNGVVYLHWTFGAKFALRPKELAVAYHVIRTEAATGLRPCSIQYCGPGKKLHPVMNYAMNIAMAQKRVRFKAHLGSPVETLYSLAGYGIASSILPVDDSDTMDFGRQQRWIAERAAFEQELGTARSNTQTPPLQDEATANPGLEPSYSDVLFGGNTKKFYESPGNLFFHNLIESLEPKYNSNCPKKAKGLICEDIIVKVKANGGRFLLFQNGKWLPVNDSAARKRITQAFRNHRRAKDSMKK